MLLEANMHEASRILTLTYADDKDRFGDPQYEHIQTWIEARRERIRYKFPDHQMRYLVVGEHGEESGHWHWHVALFGERSCQPENMMQAVFIELRGWTDLHGFASDMNLNARTSAYMCGYTLKKGENQKPFMQPSRRPGIGFPWIDLLCKQTFQKYGSRPIPSPTWFNIDGKKYPLNDGLLRYFERTYIRLGGLLQAKPSPADRREAAHHFMQTQLYLKHHGQRAAAIQEGKRIGPQTKKPRQV